MNALRADVLKTSSEYWRSDRLTRFFQGLLWSGAILAAAFLGLYFLCPKAFDYSGIGELLLVNVLAVEGLVAISELTHNQRSARASANSAVFNLHELYMSVDYHEKVRRPAWFSLCRARQDAAYREQLLAELAENSAGEEGLSLWLRGRLAGEEATEAKDYWALDYDSHRILDILGFFTALSLLNADPRIIRICNFFYESWRLALYRIVLDLENYVVVRVQQNQPGAEEQARRSEDFKRTLMTLDDWFNMRSAADADPRFQNSGNPLAPSDPRYS